jgi:protein-S-isoprenylcysteine O-methyltransferase Ste14
MALVDMLVLVSLVIFYGLFLGRTVLLYKQGVKVWVIGTSGKKFLEKILENILFPVLILWCMLVVFAALHIPLPPVMAAPLLPFSWIKYAGIVFCYLGLALFLWALVSFGRAWRIGIDENNTNELITTGVFKYSRNPIFLFMDLYFCGIMLIYPTLIFMIIALGTIAGIHFQILREEKFLLHKFGAAYTEYRRHTRRYF